MTKPLISFLLLFLALKSYGQISDLSIVASSGGASVTPGLNASWTVGESFTEELSNSSYCMAQGFHQGAVAVVAMDVTDPLQDNTITAFPNPTHDQVTVRLAEYISTAQWNLELLSIDGKVIHSQVIESASADIDFTSYRCGTYLIKISNNASFSKVITIIKQ